MSDIHGIKSYLVTANETAWGTLDGSPSYVHVPVMSYGPKLTWERRNSTPFVGLRQRKHATKVRGMPAGQLQAALYGWIPSGTTLPLARYLLEWARGTDPESLTLPSKSCEWAQGPDVANKRHLGMRSNGFTIEGTEGGPVTITIDLMGKSEEQFATAQTLPDDREKIVEFAYEDCTFTLNGSAIKPKSFRWQGQHGNTVSYNGQRTPQKITPAGLVETLAFTFEKESDAWDDILRDSTDNEYTAVITLQGLHNGTGGVGTTYSKLTATFNRLSLQDNPDTVDMANLVTQAPPFDVLKPDSSSAAITLAWSEV